MVLKKLILTNNACYKANQKITVKGIMVHSTGANNPYLKRYVVCTKAKLFHTRLRIFFLLYHTYYHL